MGFGLCGLDCSICSVRGYAYCAVLKKVDYLLVLSFYGRLNVVFAIGIKGHW